MTATAVWPLGLPHREARALYHAQPFTVYRHLRADAALLYVGCTDNLDRRHAEHRRESPWWPLVASVQSELLPNYLAAVREERYLIRTAHPLYNIVHNPHYGAAQKRRAALQQAAS